MSRTARSISLPASFGRTSFVTTSRNSYRSSTTLATCPRWEQFLSEVFEGREDLIRFVWRGFGYCLTGDVREQCLFLCWRRRNGKSLLIEILARAHRRVRRSRPHVDVHHQRTRRGGAHQRSCQAPRARIVTVQESDDGARFSEALIKSLTGGDAVTARFLHKEFFTFLPQFKPWLATNHKPSVRGVDDGFWRRVRLIPFAVSFLGREDRR